MLANKEEDLEATYRTANGRLAIKVFGEKQKDLFKELALAQQVFDATSACGVCHSTEIRFQARSYEGNDYYELVCMGCHAVFNFGQHKQGARSFPSTIPGGYDPSSASLPWPGALAGLR
jgi:hypothetical protein